MEGLRMVTEVVFIIPLTLYRHGAQIKGSVDGGGINHSVYKNELEDIDGIWRFVEIQYSRGALKVLIDKVSNSKYSKLQVHTNHDFDRRAFSYN